jgi:hypothetical protein
MSSKTMVANDDSLAEPQILREGDQIAFQLDITGVTSSLASPTMAFYQRNTGADKSATYFTGSITVPTGSIDTIVTKTTQNLKAGEWILSISATVDGQVMNVATIPVIVKRANQA